MTTLSDDAIDDALTNLDGWVRTGEMIEKTFELPNFPDAIAFVTQVGFLAEAANHHPDIDVRWRKVRIALTSHDSGGITERDVDMARSVQAL